MQIDGHNTMTYVAARGAGFTQKEAAIIAHSAQYVDDATNGGYIQFDNGAMYFRIASAHKMLDYRNSEELANHHVWIPFHFLPGNGGAPVGENPEGDSFIRKLVCKPDSPVARDVLKALFDSADTPYGLHRLGITMHVYADTWAHQGFSGVNHEINQVTELESDDPEEDESLFNKIKNFFVSNAFPLGHGAALSHPDKPYLKWCYKNGLGEWVDRDNPRDFRDAVNHMCKAMRAYRAGDKDMNLDQHEGLPPADDALVAELIQDVKSADGEQRHADWLDAIREGRFSFGKEALDYVPKGVGSWKYEAIGQDAAIDKDDDVFAYRPEFLQSDWKQFHDALQACRYSIINDVLPRYGICAA